LSFKAAAASVVGCPATSTFTLMVTGTHAEALGLRGHKRADAGFRQVVHGWVECAHARAARGGPRRAPAARGPAAGGSRLARPQGETLAASSLLRHAKVVALMPEPLLGSPEARGIVAVEPCPLQPVDLELLPTRPDTPLTPAAECFAHCLAQVRRA
jgi:hypothetical protein